MHISLSFLHFPRKVWGVCLPVFLLTWTLSTISFLHLHVIPLLHLMYQCVMASVSLLQCNHFILSSLLLSLFLSTRSLQVNQSAFLLSGHEETFRDKQDEPSRRSRMVDIHSFSCVHTTWNRSTLSTKERLLHFSVWEHNFRSRSFHQHRSDVFLWCKKVLFSLLFQVWKEEEQEKKTFSTLKGKENVSRRRKGDDRFLLLASLPIPQPL